METILSLENITKQYPGVLALDNVDLSVNKGEIRALLGKNGAGKSTLVKILSGAEHPDSGSIKIEGKLVTINTPQESFHLGLCTVYQEMSLVPGLTVAENILLGRWPHKNYLGISVIKRNEIKRIAQHSLDQLGVKINLNSIVSRLSVAQQQLVEIAKAISFDPRVLILDEPTSALSSEEVELLHKVVRNLAQGGRAIIYVTHRLQEVPEVADTVTVIRDGRNMGTITVEEATPQKIAHMMIGSDWQRSTIHHESGKPLGNVKLSVKNLSRKGILNQINFDLCAGEVLGIAGLLGSGRTELLRSIFGLDSFDEGEIWVNSKHIKHPTPKLMKEHHVAFSPEDRKRQGLVLVFSVLNNLTLASLNRSSINGVLQITKEKSLAQEMVEKLQIKTANLYVKTRTLSGGNQQKVVLGNWLNTLPHVLIMDEPTRGIDIQAKEQIFRLIRELASNGMAVLFVSSEIEEVLDVSDRILIMNQGKVTGEVNADKINLEELMNKVMEEMEYDSEKR